MKLAWQPTLQKAKRAPPCTARCGEVSSTDRPQTGSVRIAHAGPGSMAVSPPTDGRVGARLAVFVYDTHGAGIPANLSPLV